jgi:poly(hydroxyalkanoate) depolymerase family esterase
MVAKMVSDHAIDPARVFVTGLSAGGAMTSVMLATYPDVFAGGAIIAGLPYGAANNVQQAF